MHYMLKGEFERRMRDLVRNCKGTPPIDPGELCVDCERLGDGVYEGCRKPCEVYSEAGRRFDAAEKVKRDG